MLKFCHRFASRINPLKQFAIQPLTLSDQETVTDLIAENFSTAEPINSYLGHTPEMIKPMANCFVKRSIADGLGVLCVDQETIEVAAVLLVVDVYKFDLPPSILEDKRFESFMQFFEECYRDEELEQICQQPLDVIDFVCVSTASKYRKLGLYEDLMAWTMKKHPLVTQAQAATMACTHPGSLRVVKKMGWEIRKKTNIPAFVNQKGEKPFQNFVSFAEEKLGIKEFEDVHLCVFQKNASK